MSPAFLSLFLLFYSSYYILKYKQKQQMEGMKVGGNKENTQNIIMDGANNLVWTDHTQKSLPLKLASVAYK